MYPIVPDDVLGHIIDIFAETNTLDDVKKLSTLSIFSRNQCRKHIFEIITVGNKPEQVIAERHVEADEDEEDDEDDWEDEEVVDVTDTVPVISRFTLLLADHPDVASHVRRLHVVYPNGDDQRALPKTLEKLINISMLEINLGGIRWTTQLSESLLTLSHVSSFQRLRILDTFNLPVGIICSLPHLQHMQFLHVMLSAESTGKMTTPPPKLETFAVSTLDLEPFMKRRDDGKPLVDLSGLRFLHFEVGAPFAVRNISDFINDQTTPVESVEQMSFIITEVPLNSRQSEGEGFNLEQHMDGWILPNRRKLSVLELMSTVNESMTDPYSGLFTTLDKLEADNVLTSVKIVVSIHGVFEETRNWSFGDEWRPLTKVLLKPSWKRLKFVWIVVMLNGIFSDDVYKLNEYFKPLSSRPFETKIEVVA